MSGKAFTFLLLVIIKHSTSIRVFSLKYLNVLLFQQSRITANLFAIKISSLSVAIKFPVKIYALSPDQYLKSPEPCQYVDVHLEISSYDLRLWCLHPFRRSYCSLWARFPPRDLLHHHLSKQAWPNDGRFVGDPYFSWSLGFGAGLDGTIFVESLDQGETHKQALGQGSIISAVENQSDRFDEKPKQNKTKRDVFVAGRWRYGGIWEELAQEQALVGSKLNCQVCATSKYDQISSIDLHKYFKYLTKKDIWS